MAQWRCVYPYSGMSTAAYSRIGNIWLHLTAVDSFEGNPALSLTFWHDTNLENSLSTSVILTSDCQQYLIIIYMFF